MKMTKSQFLKSVTIGAVTTALTLVPMTALLNSPVFATGTATTTLATVEAQRMANLKARADLEINRRIDSLNDLSIMLGSLKRLTATQKSEFSSQLEVVSSSLFNLKTKIDADTDFATLKTDVQAVVTSYRVYAFFMPQIRIISAADAMADSASKLTDLAAKLKTRIDTASTGGTDVTTMQASLDDMNAKISDAQGLTESIGTTVVPLTPDGYPDNKVVLTTARQQLQTTINDLQTARNDAKTIITALGAANSAQ